MSTFTVQEIRERITADEALKSPEAWLRYVKQEAQSDNALDLEAAERRWPADIR